MGSGSATDIDRVQINANLFFNRAFQVNKPASTQLKYQWQMKYRWQPLLQIGLQGFGEVGTWNHWATAQRQSHRVGPTISGAWVLGNRHEVRYLAAWLSGKTFGETGSMLTARLQYVF